MNLIEITAIGVAVSVFLYAIVDLVFPCQRKLKGLFKI
jgi:hypothetical protein